jgi:hypothetical protein
LAVSALILMALVLATRPAGSRAASGSSGIAIRPSVGHVLGPVKAHIKSGRCKVKGSGAKRHFEAVAYSTDHRYQLVLGIYAWKGYGHSYEMYYGTRKPSAFHLFGPKQTVYGNTTLTATDPLTQNGEIRFRNHGAVMQVAIVAAEEDDPTKGIGLEGKMRCD